MNIHMTLPLPDDKCCCVELIEWEVQVTFLFLFLETPSPMDLYAFHNKAE